MNAYTEGYANKLLIVPMMLTNSVELVFTCEQIRFQFSQPLISQLCLRALVIASQRCILRRRKKRPEIVKEQLKRRVIFVKGFGMRLTTRNKRNTDLKTHGEWNIT